MKYLVMLLCVLCLFAVGCDTDLTNNHDHDGDGIQDHAAEDHEEEYENDEHQEDEDEHSDENVDDVHQEE